MQFYYQSSSRTERPDGIALEDALFASVKKTLVVVSMPYLISLSGVSAGYIIPNDATDDEMWDFVARRMLSRRAPPSPLAGIFYQHLFPDQGGDLGGGQDDDQGDDQGDD